MRFFILSCFVVFVVLGISYHRYKYVSLTDVNLSEQVLVEKAREQEVSFLRDEETSITEYRKINTESQRKSIDDEIASATSGVFYVMAEQEKLGHLPLQELASYAGYDDQTLLMLMKNDDIRAAKQYLRNGESMSDKCLRGEVAVRYGLTADAVEYLYSCAKSDAIGTRAIDPEISKESMLNALSIVKFATFRGDFSWVGYDDYNDGIMNIELNQKDIEQVDALAQSMFDQINDIRRSEGLDPFKKRNRGQLLTEALRNVRQYGELDLWKKSLLDIDTTSILSEVSN